jgi:hypothetical protein
MLQRIAPIALAIVTLSPLHQSPQPAKFGDIFRQYQAGDFEVVARSIRTPADFESIRPDMDVAMDDWEHRGAWRPVQVAFLLEIAIAAFANEWPVGNVQTALRRVETWLRQGPGKVRYEALFFLVDLALIETTMSPVGIESMVAGAEKRLGQSGPTPEEQLLAARLVLARALIAELRTRPQQIGYDLGSGMLDRMKLDDVVGKYETARRFPENAVESVIREGFLQYRAGRYTQALSLLESLSSIDESDLKYWRQLFLARTFVAAARPTAGRDAYLAARALAPHAQSPLIGLASLDFTQGDRGSAIAWSLQARTLPTDAVDPWWFYWRGDARFLEQRLAAFREASRR